MSRYVNFTEWTLAAGMASSTSGTKQTITVNETLSGVVTGYPFTIIAYGSGYSAPHLDSAAEVLYVVNGNPGSKELTILRGMEGTTAGAHSQNDKLHVGITGGAFENEFPWRSVKDFGALGDGTTDDTTAFSDAVGSYDGQPGGLFIPRGTYYFPSNVTISSNITLRFARHAIVKVANGIGLTLRSDIQAGLWQIFDVSLGPSIAVTSYTTRAGWRELWVEWFGAIGDGSANDTAAIQAAVDAVIAGNGGVVRFGDGDFKITADIAWDAGNVTIRGNGVPHTKVQQVTAGQSCFIVDASGTSTKGKIEFHDMQLQLNPSVDSVATHGIILKDIYEFRIENVDIFAPNSDKDRGGDGIQLTDTCADGIVTNCVIGAGVNQGIFVDDSAQIRLNNNHVHECFSHGIRVDASGGIVIDGNTITENRGHGILFQQSKLGSTEASSITGNCCRQNGSDVGGEYGSKTGNSGIYVFESDSVSVAGNTCEFNGGCGIVVKGTTPGAKGCAICGNVCNANGQAANTSQDDGIQLNGPACQYNTVTGNACIDTIQGTNKQTCGILEDNSAHDNLVMGNVVYGNTSSYPVQIGSGTVAVNNKGDARPLIFWGSGVPAGSEPIGSLYLRTDGGDNTTLYVKETSGWDPKD